jgi:Purine-nucleoside phosphorylase
MLKQYNTVRNAFGYTGTYKGVPVSVQGTGMGVPSISIYVEELIRDFDCEILIRVGSAGAIQEDVHVRDVVLAQGRQLIQVLTVKLLIIKSILHH